MPLTTNTIHKYALRSLTPDDRDFSHSQVFGSIADLPTHDFLVAVPLEIKNQDINYPSDFCTSYAASECAEDEDQVLFVPEWTFAQSKGLKALTDGPTAYDEYGLDLRDICKGAVKKGFLPRNKDPFKCDTVSRPSRDFLANPLNWGEVKDYDSPYKKASYFLVDGPRDLFDNIRATLLKNLGERRSVIVGCLWRDSWTVAKNGIIPTDYEIDGSGHAFKICGQKTIDDVIYLVAQLSDGIGMGDQGYFYFPREVVNKEFAPFGAFTFTNVNRDKALWHITHGVPINGDFFTKALRFIAHYLSI